jgi:hypothetical protein
MKPNHESYTIGMINTKLATNAPFDSATSTPLPSNIITGKASTPSELYPEQLRNIQQLP